MEKSIFSLLEELTGRHHVAEKRLQEATQGFQQAHQAQAIAQAAFQKAQQELNLAQQQFHGWNVALATVQAEEAEKAKTANTTPVDSIDVPSKSTPTATAAPPPQETIEATETGSGKTELVRDLLRQHPHGITATELWKRVQGQFNHRAYLYNVLKRLEKNEGVTCRRGKYAFRSVLQDSTREEVTTVQ